jgi:hypothetical protein
MTRPHLRPHLLAAALLAATATTAFAQGPPVASPTPELPPGPSRCLMGSTAVRATTGAVLGGWLGFVAAKIRMSDWSDASHSAAGNRLRNQMTIGGVILGAVSASLLHVNKNCTATATPTSSPRAGRQPITADEIARAGLNGSVYDVVYSLRRNWLNTRGLNSGNESVHIVVVKDSQVVADGEPQLVVYLDNLKLGTLNELKRLPIVGVTSIRYYDPAEANYLWGMGHTHGAIQVMTVER